MKFDKLISKLIEDYGGGMVDGGNEGAMGSGDIVDKSVNDPQNKYAIFTPFKDPKNLKTKKDDDDEEEDEIIRRDSIKKKRNKKDN